LGVIRACHKFSVPPSSVYLWKQKYKKKGELGFYREQPVAYRHPRRTAPEVVEKILALRTEHQLGFLRIMYYLDRCHEIKISESTVSRVLKAHGLSSLPQTAPKCALHTQRYAETVPGHHVQVDVKFPQLKDQVGKTVKRYQYMAIDDATRIRVLLVF
jgi:transposase